MKIFIDGEPFTPSSPEVSESKRQLLDEIDGEILKKGLTYTTITVDGVEMDSSAFLLLRKGREAHFKTCEVKSLVLESLQEAINYLPRLSGGIQNIASGLERKENENISEQLINFAEGLDWLVSVMQKSQLLLLVKDSELPGKEETVAKLNKSLKSVSECFENGRIMEISFHMRQILPELKAISDYIVQLLEIAQLKK